MHIILGNYSFVLLTFRISTKKKTLNDECNRLKTILERNGKKLGAKILSATFLIIFADFFRRLSPNNQPLFNCIVRTRYRPYALRLIFPSGFLIDVPGAVRNPLFYRANRSFYFSARKMDGRCDFS